jgi:hypothetical protein
MTLAEVAAARGLTPQQFIDLLDVVPGWPNAFEADGLGELSELQGPPHAKESVLVGALSRAFGAGLGRPPVGILRESNRKTLYIQQPNSWRPL